ncbi:DUF1542 domain-containing protein, partial [Staphylococcus epidermidis]|uniref:DUF1542 domain-containing protein n=1 Tax=Staphylococcus epidermidis TaxID=1282 RepID=UPI0011A309E3
MSEGENNGRNRIEEVGLSGVKRENGIGSMNGKGDEEKRLIEGKNNGRSEEKGDGEGKVNEGVISGNENIKNGSSNRDVDEGE